VRSIAYRFDDLFAFGRTLGSHDQDLPLPPGEQVSDGEWVLAIFEIGAHKRATASAARGVDRGNGAFELVFERRDWERLQTFAEAKSEKMRAARPVPPESIPVEVDSKAEAEFKVGAADQTMTSPLAPIPSPNVPRGLAESSPRPPPRPSSGKLLTSSGRFPVAQSARVLLVDDDGDIRDVVGAMLEAVGLTIEPVTNAEEALDRVREKHFDLLVLDWSLPGMTGLDLCRKIRSEPSLASIPVLFLTAHSSSKDIVDAFASGADDYVSKPFRAPELGARIFGLLRRARIAQGQP
jgi:two-component system phosphate regulon response regulator PhoB